MGQVRVDGSPSTALAVCACGWRGAPRRYRSDAWTEANAHIRTCHRDDPAALNAAAKRSRRAL
jgi:hypothetical protein